MWWQFFFQNIHFAVNMITALIFFLVAWLYSDAWSVKKTFKDFCKVAGFLLLAFSFVLHAVHIEGSINLTTFLSEQVYSVLFMLTRLGGYIILIIGLIADPVQPKPSHKGTTMLSSSAVLLGGSLPLLVIYPVLSLIVGLLYLHKATVGLERHLKLVSYSFFVLALSELISVTDIFRSTSNIDLYNLVAPYGVSWIFQLILIGVAAFLLRKWAFVYLLKRFQAQIFVIFISSIFIVFLIGTFSFTSILFSNIEKIILDQLRTDVKVLGITIDTKKNETLSDAQLLSKDPNVIKGIKDKAKTSLNDTASNFALSKKQNMVLIVSQTGEVLARGEDPNRVGDSVSDNPLVKQALNGKPITSIVSTDGVLAKELSIRSATPVMDSGAVIGVVVTGTTIDSAFVDGLKDATGLDASIYADNLITATTLAGSDERSRLVGLKESRKNITDQVLLQDKVYAGPTVLKNIPYYAAYSPLHDNDDNILGMLFIGKPQQIILQTLDTATQVTFLGAALLLVLLIIPSYFIAKYISDQVD